MKELEIILKNGQIYSHIREDFLEDQPEERVRQEFVCQLVNHYGYNLDQMAEEIKLTTSQRGTGRASADLVIWKTKEDKLQNKKAFLVVELKAGYLDLKVEDCYQGYNYATWSRAQLFAVSNGKELQVYKTIEDELPLKLSPVNDIPLASEILDDKKLENILEKTREFTGDQFAKVLQKCHNIIRNNDKLSPEAAFDEISKILFIKIMYERKPKQEAIFSFKQFEKLKKEFNIKFLEKKKNQIEWKEENINIEVDAGNMDKAKILKEELVIFKKQTPPLYFQDLFEDVKEEFAQDNIFDIYEKINLRESSFEQIVKELQAYNLTITSSDVKGIAFEKFLGRTLRGELGQFFTPRTIVDFMVDILDPQEGEFIADPSCGSGGFLIRAFEKMRETIEMSFIEAKKKKQKEIFGNGLENIDDEELKKQYEEYLQQVNKEYDARIKELCPNSLFGTDANPRMAGVSKMNMIMHGDGHNGIHHNDGLLNTHGIYHGKFNVILANPPFGSRVPKDLIIEDNKISETLTNRDNLSKTELEDKLVSQLGKGYQQVSKNLGKPLLSIYKTGKMSTLTEVLFMERNLNLLEKGGRMGVVLPEGVLNNSNLQKVRDFFEGRAKIVLITSIPQDVFIASGATVKPSLVFLKKFTESEELEYKNISESANEKITAEYANELLELETTLKNTKTAPEKKTLKAELKKLNEKIAEKIKKKIKEDFNYTIPIAEVEKAGISTTGSAIENELEPLAKEFAEYRKQNNLW